MARACVWLCAAFVGIGGIMWGYEVSSTNGVKEMSGFRQTFNISYSPSDHATNETAPCVSVDDVETSALLGAIVSVFSIGALVGALLSGLLSDLAGRKVTLIAGASLYALGGTLQTSSFFLWMLFPARIISGIGTGITLQICPIYIAEVAPKERRGMLVAMVNAVGTVGLVSGIVMSTITERYVFGWRVTASVQILVGTVLVLGAFFLYETPRFLVKKRKDANALKVLVKIHGDHTRAQSELTEIQMSIRGPTANQKKCTRTLKHFCSVSIIQRVLIGYVLMLLTRICGVPVIAYYSVSIFCKVGVDGFIGTSVQVVVMFVAQITGALLIDKCGRKPMLLLGTMVMGILLSVAAALIQLFDLEEGTNLSTAQRTAGYFVIILICLFMSSFVLSFGTSTWIIVSEIYPLQIRGIGAALGQLGWWSGTIFMGEVGPVLLSSPLRTSGTFYLFAGMCFLAFLHALLLIPETKGQSLESIEHLFAEPWNKRVNALYYIRCGCFCCPRRTGMELVPTDIDAADSEEREHLQEPLDQISLSSGDSVEADISNINSLKNFETSV